MFLQCYHIPKETRKHLCLDWKSAIIFVCFWWFFLNFGLIIISTFSKAGLVIYTAVTYLEMQLEWKEAALSKRIINRLPKWRKSEFACLQEWYELLITHLYPEALYFAYLAHRGWYVSLSMHLLTLKTFTVFTVSN